MNKQKHLLLLVSSLLSLSSCGISIHGNSSSSASSSLDSSLDSSKEQPEVSSSETSTSEDELTSSEERSLEEDDDFAPEGYSLYWSDEFDGKKLNENNWEYMIGNGSGGWGNNEAQYYTDENDVVSNGTLKIFGRRESVTEKERTFNYTSTRIRTYNKVYTTYGYIAARIKLSAVKGLWPAFWMLPETGYGQTGTTWWPTSGEIDIMENQGRVSNRTSGALHYAVNGNIGTHTYQTKSVAVDTIERFHVYAVNWTEDAIYWSVDGEVFFSLPKGAWNQGYGTKDASPFNKDFHILLNLAIGGTFDGGVEPPEDWKESTMEVDYVRIYHENE